MKEYNIEDILTLTLKDSIEYKIYLPGRATDYIQKKIYEEKIPYELEMLKDILSRINSGDVVLDIGANIGNHSLFLAAHGMSIHSFEANRDLFDIMNVSVQINEFDDRVKTYNIGLSDKKDIACFEKIDESNLGGQSLTLGEGGIEVLPLSEFSFDKKVSLLKIDVEGMETNVLRGAFNLISSDRPILYIEAINHLEFKAIFAELEKLSYVYWETFNATPTHLFLPQESVTQKDILARDLYRNTYESYRMTQQLNLTKRVLGVYNSDLGRLKKDLSKQIVNYHGVQERFNQFKLDNEIVKLKLENELSNLKIKNKSSNKEIEKLLSQNRQLEKVIQKQKMEIEKTRNSLSFKLGHTVIKSTKFFVKLPKNIYKSLTKKKIKNKKIVNSSSSKKIVKKKKIPSFLSSQQVESPSKVKIATIMDEFTYNSFRYECDLMQITPDKWREEIAKNRPDFVFVESAWQGKEELWKTKISNQSTELVEMLNWCSQQKIPTIFWNKEDPVHFDTFIKTAELVDFVFTTDIDCVAKYKKVLEHERVNFLPFAAQPYVHNPIELYDRKDAFNFAGSYYLRYPERQRDFKVLINAVKEFKSVDIFDRNYDNPHPHYTFPDEYKSMILGKLPFEEIDKAYKGYRYGINMNTIKQSQSMFARRVFELLASNTVTVSNFSRGMRLLFGDLVISSDNSREISRQLEKICNSEIDYRKLRLLGLRKVMSEHIYANRLAYILSKLSQTEVNHELPKVFLFATVENIGELDTVLKIFDKQSYNAKKLFILKSFVDNNANSSVDIVIEENQKQILKLLAEELSSNKALFGFINPKDYYGKNYLTDLVYASTYSDAMAFGKASYYKSNSKEPVLINDTKQYHYTDTLPLASSLIVSKNITIEFIEKYKKSLDDDLTLEKMFSIDEFNYCRNADISEDIISSIVDDMTISNQGISFRSKLAKISESMQQSKSLEAEGVDDSNKLDAQTLFNLFPQSKSNRLVLSFEEEKFKIVSRFEEGKYAYTYATKQFSREELNLVLNSKFVLEANSSFPLRTVFEFQDENGDKISHAMNAIGGTHALAIPMQCKYIRFGFRVEGRGEATISALVFGESRDNASSVIGRSPYLVLTKQYPSYTDLYSYGFLHSRIRAYKKQGLDIEIFRIASKVKEPYREFEDVDIASGDAVLLDKTLSTGQYKHILVHLLDDNMWSVLEKYIEKIKVTVWIHGAEAQAWQRRVFEFENIAEDEIIRQKKLSDKRIAFLKSVLSKSYPNLHLVFVSNYLTKTVQEDLGISLEKDRYSIVHNYIDSSIFRYSKKKAEDRLKILTIRPYAKRVYANDLMVEAIKLLSNRPFFSELEFTVVGDGELFEKTVKPLREYDNVEIEQRFLTHSEISEYHGRHGILLVPTRMDTQGVSRDEAMSSGLVPITTDVAAIPEFVDESCGIIVPAEDSKALANAIEYLYNNPKEYLELSKQASKRVMQKCGYEQTILKEIELIRC